MSGPVVAGPVPEPCTLDHLAGDWRIWQLRGGHRFSADDLLTADLAATLARTLPRSLPAIPSGTPAPSDTAAPANAPAPPLRLLDLGAGIGSVGLLTLWRLPAGTTLTMVEVQAVSHALARATVAENGLQERVSLRLGDLRDDAVFPPGERFDLVTGSPPYIPLGKGHVSPHPQRAGARMELRGTIFDYAARAAAVLVPDGAFACCFAAGDPRVEAALLAAGLHLRLRRDVVFRAHLPPTITLFAATLSEGPREDLPPLVIRDATGAWTAAYLDVRRRMGAPAGLRGGS